MQGETALVTLDFDVPPWTGFVFPTPPLVLNFRYLRSVLYISRDGFGWQTLLLPALLNFTFFFYRQKANRVSVSQPSIVWK